MLTVLIAILLLAAAVGAIYLLLKNMGENGIEAAAPGSCRSGRCGVRRAPADHLSDEQVAEVSAETAEVGEKEAA